nr:hypothetical protein GCM10020093_025970 [Planobispora longispora]
MSDRGGTSENGRLIAVPYASIKVSGESRLRLDDGFERIRRELKLPEEFPVA